MVDKRIVLIKYTPKQLATIFEGGLVGSRVPLDEFLINANLHPYVDITWAEMVCDEYWIRCCEVCGLWVVSVFDALCYKHWLERALARQESRFSRRRR